MVGIRVFVNKRPNTISEVFCDLSKGTTYRYVCTYACTTTYVHITIETAAMAMTTWVATVPKPIVYDTTRSHSTYTQQLHMCTHRIQYVYVLHILYSIHVHTLYICTVHTHIVQLYMYIHAIYTCTCIYCIHVQHMY